MSQAIWTEASAFIITILHKLEESTHIKHVRHKFALLQYSLLREAMLTEYEHLGISVTVKLSDKPSLYSKLYQPKIGSIFSSEAYSSCSL